MPAKPNPSADWPGKSLGLPASGPRSVARIGRRAAAIAIDWAIAYGLALLWAGGEGWVTLATFAALQILFISTVGGSVGHLLLGLRVVPIRPGLVGVLKPTVRTALLCLVIPAAIWDADQRGMHDRLAGTVLVRR